MRGARGARLWRSLDKLRIGSCNGRGGGSRDASSSEHHVLGVTSRRASSQAARSGRAVVEASGGCAGGVQERHQHQQRGVMHSGLTRRPLPWLDIARREPALCTLSLCALPVRVGSMRALAREGVDGAENGVFTSSECRRATSDSDSYSPGPQKEPLLRPKEIDVEDEVDDEPLEDDAGEIVSDSPPRELSSLELELQNAPRRKQRFILQKALKIRNMESEGRPRKQGFTMKVVDVNRTCKVTKGGGILTFTALVICGNGDGVAGYGKGKSAEVSAAVDKAYARALRNLHYFERFDGHTVFHENHSKYGQTKIYLWPSLSGTGMRASHTVGGILRLAGFKNVKSKVVGSRHSRNTVKAVFQALSEIETPEEAAEREGRERVAQHA